MNSNLVVIGTVMGTHHLTGTVKVNSIFEEIETVLNEKVILEKDNIKKLLTIKKIKRINDKKILIDFEEIKNIEQAREINGFKIKIRRDLLPEKNKDEFYIKDLLGLSVFENDIKIGEIIDIMDTAAHEILIVEDIKSKKEIMIPLIEEFVVEIKFDENRVDVELIDGMREE